MFLVYDYCHNTESDVVDHIAGRVTWNGELITDVQHQSGQVFQVQTLGSTYTYTAPECDFHGHYPPLFPFDPEYLGLLFIASLTPLVFAWIVTALRRLT